MYESDKNAESEEEIKKYAESLMNPSDEEIFEMVFAQKIKEYEEYLRKEIEIQDLKEREEDEEFAQEEFANSDANEKL